MMTEILNKTIALVRVSTIGQTEEKGGTGIQFQTEKLSQYVTLNDLNLIKTITDVCSGGLETRDGIETLKEHIKEGKVEIVLVWNISRAFRSMIHFAKFYEFLKNHNVELISVSEGIRSSRKEGEMMFGIMASIASYEKELITDRMKSGRTTKVQNGERGFGGRLPFGYKKKDGEIVLDEMDSKIVSYIFKKMNQLNKRNITKTKKTQTMLKLLKDRNFTYNGSPFKSWNVKSILKNKFYIGEMSYGSITSNHKYDTLISKRMFNQVCLG
ncbi:MAG: recombinase family protein [Candidatus Marinimicrobia bacterium]|nr:recombinase family protein [Candidatus Neomarinimicrobiota bacterium]